MGQPVRTPLKSSLLQVPERSHCSVVRRVDPLNLGCVAVSEPVAQQVGTGGRGVGRADGSG